MGVSYGHQQLPITGFEIAGWARFAILTQLEHLTFEIPSVCCCSIFSFLFHLFVSPVISFFAKSRLESMSNLCNTLFRDPAGAPMVLNFSFLGFVAR